jgi:iron-sulfur cluster assembly protein
MQTATAYRPHTLPDVPPPPRNAGIPDTSIAADAPYNAPAGSYNAFQSTDRKPSISVREGEAQKTTPAQPAETAAKPRRSRLRPRKAAMTLTPTAVSQLQSMLSQPDPKMIRVGVKNRGCSGLAYNLEYVEKPGKFDEVVEQDGVKVLIDSKALFSIIGSEMDWHEDKLSQRFVFRNPNISEYICIIVIDGRLTFNQRNNAAAENPLWSNLSTLFLFRLLFLQCIGRRFDLISVRHVFTL